MSEYVKPQSPLYSKENDAYFYPLTTSDQVIMPDGSRMNESIISKSQVVNNFTTTEEGFVADARALKVLNDKFSFEQYPTHSGNSNKMTIDFTGYDDGVYEVMTIRAYAMVIKNSARIQCGNTLGADNTLTPSMTNGVLSIDTGEWYGYVYIRKLI